MPEGDAELPDDGLPDEQDEEDDPCPKLVDVLRMPQEDLPE